MKGHSYDKVGRHIISKTTVSALKSLLPARLLFLVFATRDLGIGKNQRDAGRKAHRREQGNSTGGKTGRSLCVQSSIHLEAQFKQVTKVTSTVGSLPRIRVHLHPALVWDGIRRRSFSRLKTVSLGGAGQTGVKWVGSPASWLIF